MLSVIDLDRNVFSGPNAALEFLKPDNCRPSPMIEITPCLRAKAMEVLGREIRIPSNVRFLAKAMTQAPLCNVKGGPAFEFLDTKTKRGEMKGKKVIIAPSSGGFAYSVGLTAPHFGDYEVVAVVPGDLAPGKELMLKCANVFQLSHMETPGNSGIDLACRLGQIDGCIVFNQYADMINPLAHAKYTAPQIWEQTEGRVSAVASGMGTSGTLGGCVEYFREIPAPVAMFGGYLEENSAVPGVRTLKRIKDQVRLDYKTGITHVEVLQKEAYEASWCVSRYGILCGPSTGVGIVTALKLSESRSLEALVNSDGEVVIVIVVGDLPHFYFEKFTMALGPARFPQMPKLLVDRLTGRER